MMDTIWYYEMPVNLERKEKKMPVIKIFGMPRNFRGIVQLYRLIPRIQSAVASVRELDIGGDQVSVFVPDDLSDQGLGEELIAEVCGLFDLPGRTLEVRNRLCISISAELAAFAKENLPQCFMIETYIVSTIPPDEYAGYKKDFGTGEFIPQA